MPQRREQPVQLGVTQRSTVADARLVPIRVFPTWQADVEHAASAAGARPNARPYRSQAPKNLTMNLRRNKEPSSVNNNGSDLVRAKTTLKGRCLLPRLSVHVPGRRRIEVSLCGHFHLLQHEVECFAHTADCVASVLPGVLDGALCCLNARSAATAKC